VDVEKKRKRESGKGWDGLKSKTPYTWYAAVAK
jgi:hypothetical protein